MYGCVCVGVAACYLYAPKIMQSNPVWALLCPGPSSLSSVLISRRYSQLLNVISAFKCELHLSPTRFSPPTSNHQPRRPLSRLLHVQIFGHLNAASTAAAEAAGAGAGAASWPIKWAAVSEARPYRSKTIPVPVAVFPYTLHCHPLPPVQPVVPAHRFTGCGCAMLFGLRSKLTSVLFVRFPFALLRRSFAFFAADPALLLLHYFGPQEQLAGGATAGATAPAGCCFCIFLSAFSFNLRNWSGNWEINSIPCVSGCHCHCHCYCDSLRYQIQVSPPRLVLCVLAHECNGCGQGTSPARPQLDPGSTCFELGGIRWNANVLLNEIIEASEGRHWPWRALPRKWGHLNGCIKRISVRCHALACPAHPCPAMSRRSTFPVALESKINNCGAAATLANVLVWHLCKSRARNRDGKRDRERDKERQKEVRFLQNTQQ